MSKNSETILDDIVDGKHAEIAAEMPKQNFFEIFCAEQVTKDFDLTYAELTDGIVDGEHDGGIDAIYTFLNGEILSEEEEFIVPKAKSHLNLVVIQSKFGSGFSETQIEKLISSTRNLLDLSRDIDGMIQYNAQVRAKIGVFRSAYKKLASKFPSLSIRYVYAARRSADEVHPNVKIKADELVALARSQFEEAGVAFDFFGARELVASARKRPNFSFELKFDKSLNGENGYIALVKLRDFYNFLRGGGDTVRADLFESNVRDYQGSTEVNADISATLSGDRNNDFWWFNNGVTVLASRALSSGSVITIENPQIVNGLQTSSQIALYFDEYPDDDPRTVMVKIVASEDEDVRDRIIKATNNQNMVPLASLRATDKVQRDIEHALKIAGLFYDRRKNYYKNEGRPLSRIISINLLAQAMMTLLLGEPDNARARPSSLIKLDHVYRSLFSEKIELDAYVVAADLIRRIEIALRLFWTLRPEIETI